NWIHYLRDPVIQRAVWSGVALLLVFFGAWFFRRIFRSLKVGDERRYLYLRWINYTSLSLFLLILVRIWAFQYLVEIFDSKVMERMLISVLVLLLFGLVVYSIRRLIQSQKIEEEKRRLYIQWITYASVFLCVFILFRVWTSADLFDFFRNAIIEKLFKSAFALGIVYFALFFVRRFINSLKIDIKKRHEYRKRVGYAAALIYFLILIPLWAGSTQQWATMLSVMGAGVALALHEVLLNIAGWAYIMIRKPYRTGDRIELGNVRGDVIDIQLFQTTLLEIGGWVDGDQSTGRVVNLPHGQIFRNPLHNYTKGFEFIWNEISVLVTFESDWEKAKEILLRCGEEESREVQEHVQRKIDRMAREYLIYYKKFTPFVYTRIDDNGVKLTLRYLTEAKKRRTGVDIISQKILREIGATPGIDFAYPTYRIYKRGE
ncbi:MAG: mechanosensitive ion channel family protein, partial [bacterium]